MRSLLSAFVEAHHQAILNSLLGLFQSLGVMLAGPVLFGALQVGIDMGGAWIGLPFIIAAICGACATLMVFIYRLPADRPTS